MDPVQNQYISIIYQTCCIFQKLLILLYGFQMVLPGPNKFDPSCVNDCYKTFKRYSKRMNESTQILLLKNSSLEYPPCFNYSFWNIGLLLNTWWNITFTAARISLHGSFFWEGVTALFPWWNFFFFTVHLFIHSANIP